MMPLTIAGTGEELMIKKIGGSPEMRSHLNDLGFVKGENIQIVSAIGGNLIVLVKGVRIAVGRDMAKHIMI